MKSEGKGAWLLQNILVLLSVINVYFTIDSSALNHRLVVNLCGCHYNTVCVTSAGAGGAVIGRSGLAHSAAASRPAGGQRQQRGVHSGVSPRTVPQGRQETLRQS